jgi:hypothetical protein
MAEIDAVIRTIAKPVVVCCLGAETDGGAPGHRVSTLEEAAMAAAALARGESSPQRPLADPAAFRSRLARVPAADRRGPQLLGLFTGGTLAEEARLLLEPLLGVISGESEGGHRACHRILDLGADEFTRGRPHPMIDPSSRAERVVEAAKNPEVGVLLVDLVLGRAAHPDPASVLASAVREARAVAAADGRSLAIVASVVGTEGDPQGLSAQTAALEAAGVEVLPSNGQATRFAALLARPDLEQALLAEPS